ncbi:putative oligopeptide transporter [Paramyrothecium foliicola]|nr:putative oligopeptide transporter [Paramyrothecium foliicola]
MHDRSTYWHLGLDLDLDLAVAEAFPDFRGLSQSDVPSRLFAAFLAELILGRLKLIRKSQEQKEHDKVQMPGGVGATHPACGCALRLRCTWASPVQAVTSAKPPPRFINVELRQTGDGKYSSNWETAYCHSQQSRPHSCRGIPLCQTRRLLSEPMDSLVDPPRPLAAVASPLSDAKKTLTPRAVACGVFLGSIICLANMYFGLQAGMVNAMPMQSALLAFAIFRSLRPFLSRSLSPPETTIIEIIAGSVGLAPFTAGLTSFVPALDFLANHDEKAVAQFSSNRLLLWAVATCGIGVVISAPFRTMFILREQLRFPSATATATLIGALFQKNKVHGRESPPALPPSGRLSVGASGESRSSSSTSSTPSDSESASELGEQDYNKRLIRNILWSLAGSAGFLHGRSAPVALMFEKNLLAYFFPVLHQVPVFGINASNNWLWAFDMSPAYVGYGMIIGPGISMSMLLGAVVGWGILSPLAKTYGWAPGPVHDWETGSRGWIIWVALGLMLGDSLVGIIWIVLKPFLLRAIRGMMTRRAAREQYQNHLPADSFVERLPLLRDLAGSNVTVSASNESVEEDWPSSALTTRALLIWVGLSLSILYFVSLIASFADVIPASATVAAFFLMPLASFISMRSLGETDNGASIAISRMAQFSVSLFVPASTQRFTSANILLGGAIESAASQASQHMGGLKTAYLTSTRPRSIFYGQIIGTYTGAIIAICLYKAYTSTKKIPSDEFGIPDAHLYIIASRLIQNSGMPPRALQFGIWATVLGAIFGMLRITGAKKQWRHFVPSGVAIGVGMYIVPAISLPRALGGLLMVVGQRKYSLRSFTLMCCATGLILGQGVVSVLALIFDTAKVPTPGNR